MEAWIRFDRFIWSSDWIGHEVGYPDIEVVGLYVLPNEMDNYDTHFYIDMDTLEILECWHVNNGEDE